MKRLFCSLFCLSLMCLSVQGHAQSSDVQRATDEIKAEIKVKDVLYDKEAAIQWHKAQIWSAVCVYVLVAIIKKRLGIKASLYEMLQILSLTLFEKTQLLQLFSDIPPQILPREPLNQLNLFD